MKAICLSKSLILNVNFFTLSDKRAHYLIHFNWTSIHGVLKATGLGYGGRRIQRFLEAPALHSESPHILREADVHTVSSRQGATQAVTEMHTREEILVSTKAKVSRVGSTWADPWRMQPLVLRGRGEEGARGASRTSDVICRSQGRIKLWVPDYLLNRKTAGPCVWVHFLVCAIQWRMSTWARVHRYQAREVGFAVRPHGSAGSSGRNTRGMGEATAVNHQTRHVAKEDGMILLLSK